MPRESIFSLHDEALLRRRRGERIIDGTVGVLLDDAGRLAVLPTVAAALDELPPLTWASYAPLAGEADFLNAVREKVYPPDLHTSAIAVATPGATGAVSLAIAMGLEPGEALLTRSLHFASYVDLAAARGRRLTTFTAFGSTGRFDVAALARRLATLVARQSHLLIVLNDPCQNPTGYTMSRMEWDAVADVIEAVALQRPTTLLLDAAYVDFAPPAWDPPYGVLARLAESADVLTAWSASKSFTAYGLRVGALLALCPRAGTVTRFCSSARDRACPSERCCCSGTGGAACRRSDRRKSARRDPGSSASRNGIDAKNRWPSQILRASFAPTCSLGTISSSSIFATVEVFTDARASSWSMTKRRATPRRRSSCASSGPVERCRSSRRPLPGSTA
jgi:aromatic-amino-acid transaminase